MAKDRGDQPKLWLILFQIKRIRARLNFLALQYWLFSTVAVCVIAAALIFAAALTLGPLAFAFAAAVAVMLALSGLARVARHALQRTVNLSHAAQIADQRAGLKGRLLTVLAMAQAPRRSALWPYLVEDTYGLREEFEPARIEPRWLSRSIGTLAAAALIALLIIPLTSLQRARTATAAPGAAGEITADIGNLEIRPADPALEPNAEVYVDDATMRKLQARLAPAAGRENDGAGLSHWMNRARRMAGDLQDQLTGRQAPRLPPARLRLTDRNRNRTGDNQSNDSTNDPARRGRADAHPPAPGANGRGAVTGAPPSTALPGAQADRLARGAQGDDAQAGGNPSQPWENSADSFDNGGAGAGADSSRGRGADPQNLFGPAGQQPLGTDNFRIAIEAQPSDESSGPGAPGYIPPKVRVPLNASQLPDEPLVRAEVPADDQMTIKRVFQR